mgnify:FL=1
MKCFNHEDREAVATCQRCGKGLCKECASKYTPCLCDECYQAIQTERGQEFIRQDREHENAKQQALIDTTSEFITAAIKGLICAVVFYFIFAASGSSSPIVEALWFFFVPYGWAFFTYLSQWLPLIFLSGFLLYLWYVFKLIFAMITGPFCFAYQLIMFLVNRNRIKKS